MSDLLASLRSAGSALDVYQRALDVVQNNVTNSTTPGYAKQSLRLEALPFDTTEGLAGGVSGRGLDSARNEYAEDEVRRQLQSLGFLEGQAQGAASVEGLFDVSGNGGVSAALTQFYQSFSAWSISPASSDGRQAVIAAATQVANSVRVVSSGIANTAGTLKTQIGSAVGDINQLTATVQQYNVKQAQASQPDPGRDANLHAALEQLAELVDTTTLTQSDGTVTVLLNGGAPLVMGDTQYALQANQDSSGNPVVLDWRGNNASAQIAGGKLGGLLQVSGGIVADTQKSLNQFAQSFAATVNGILTSGSVSPNNSTAGTPLFAYDAAQGASSLQLDSAATAGGLAAADAAGSANGIPLKLASLANSTAAGGIGSATFSDFFSGIAAAAGRASAAAKQGQETQQQVVAQTRALRDSNSGVSLDEQAVQLMQFQRSYQAVARVITTLNDMTGDLLNLIR